MKNNKLLLVLICGILLCKNLFATFDPAYFTGFNGNFKYGQVGLFTKDPGYSFEFNPTIGSILWKNIAVGISIDIAKMHYAGHTNYDYHESGYGPFFRYYIHLNDHHAVFPSFQYSSGSYSNVSDSKVYDPNFNIIGTISSDVSGDYSEISPGAGYTFFFNENFAAEFIYSYNIRSETQTIKVIESTSSGTFEDILNQNVSRQYHELNIGFLFYFHCKASK